MKRDAASSSSRPRSRKKAVALAPAPEPVEATPEPTVMEAPGEPAGAGKNVNSLESGLSLAAGVLFLVGALFPRTLKQLLLLGIGGFLVQRGMTGRCGVYGALGIDTAKEPLLRQINDKFTAPTASEAAGS